MARVTVTLLQDERDALLGLALAELRTPRDQVRHILRSELVRRGLLRPRSEEKIVGPITNGREVIQVFREEPMGFSKHAVLEFRVIPTSDGTTFLITLCAPPEPARLPGEGTYQETETEEQ